MPWDVNVSLDEIISNPTNKNSTHQHSHSDLVTMQWYSLLLLLMVLIMVFVRVGLVRVLTGEGVVVFSS